MDDIDAMLRALQSKGVQLWMERGELRYRAPKGALTTAEAEQLRRSRARVAAVLAGACGESGERCETYRVPLTFAQMAHLYYFSLHGPSYVGRAVRIVASARRLHGRLDLAAFRRAVAEIVRRHEALRTRIVVVDGVTVQEIGVEDRVDFDVHDLTGVSQGLREQQLVQLIDLLILEPIDLAKGPLAGVRLIRMGDDEHVLVLALVHEISDGTSLVILWRDLLTAYVQAARSLPFSLPEVRMQFREYALRQHRAVRDWVEQHSSYWEERLAGCGRLRFPDDAHATAEPRFGWGIAPVRIDRELKAQLREWCRVHRTTMVMTVFAAYAALVLRWCCVPEAVLPFQSNGRVEPQVENTVGIFTSVLYLRLCLHEYEIFPDFVARVTEEYCRAYEHADFSYLTTRPPGLEVARNPAFNWTPRGTKVEMPDFGGADGAITTSPMYLTSPALSKLELDCEPALQLYDAGDEVAGRVMFPKERFSAASMDLFARNFQRLLRAVATLPVARVGELLSRPTE